MVYYRLYRKSLSLLFIFICTQYLLGTTTYVAKPDTALSLWKQSRTLQQEADFILQQIENDTTTQHDSLAIQEKIAAFSLLLKGKQLKESYYLVVIDSLNHSTPPQEELLELYNTIHDNASTQLLNSRRTLESAQNLNEPDSLLKIYQAAIDYQNKGLAGLKLMKAIHEADDNTHPLFSHPPNVSKITERYSLAEADVTLLIKKEAPAGKSEVAKADTVTRGYSPFTSEYKDFVFEADSIARGHPEITTGLQDTMPTTAAFEIDTAIQRQLNTVWNQNFQYLKKDTLFTHAAQDSLFPHEMVTLYDKSSLKRYWTNYLNQWTELAKAEVPKESKSSTGIRVKPEYDSRQSTATKETEELKNAKSTDTPQKIATIPTVPPAATNETLYFIQIAASRSPMPLPFIHTFYKGDDSVYTRIEENWFKYQIGKTPTFSEALKTLNNTGVKGAFIVPYEGSKKLMLWQTLRPKTTVIPNKVLKDLTFVVQIAASRDQLSGFQMEQLTKNIEGTVREIVEDNWYKYQIVVGASYSEARKKWQQTGITKSFIVAYYNNDKIEMTEAFRILKGN
ncbi:MAG: hypothetical protein JEZ14_13950 [Marinilabiliaceae bacterium]|nr:hypothetical protein [Marinilabiliaceae bacterium]